VIRNPQSNWGKKAIPFQGGKGLVKQKKPDKVRAVLLESTHRQNKTGQDGKIEVGGNLQREDSIRYVSRARNERGGKRGCGPEGHMIMDAGEPPPQTNPLNGGRTQQKRKSPEKTLPNLTIGTTTM